MFRTVNITIYSTFDNFVNRIIESEKEFKVYDPDHFAETIRNNVSESLSQKLIDDVLWSRKLKCCDVCEQSKKVYSVTVGKMKKSS